MTKLSTALLAPFLWAAALHGATDGLAGRWEGVVRAPAREVPLVIDLAPDKAGVWQGSAISPGYGMKGAPLANLKVAESGVSFTIKGGLGDPELQGHLTPDGKLAGEYRQAGNTATFSLEKSGPPQVELPRPSTAVRRELVGAWQGEYEFLGDKRRALLNLANGERGAATATFVVIGKQENKIPVSLVTDEGGIVTVESQEYGITLELRPGDTASELKGMFLQGPIELPMTLRRGGAQ